MKKLNFLFIVCCTLLFNASAHAGIKVHFKDEGSFPELEQPILDAVSANCSMPENDWDFYEDKRYSFADYPGAQETDVYGTITFVSKDPRGDIVLVVTYVTYDGVFQRIKTEINHPGDYRSDICKVQ